MGCQSGEISRFTKREVERRSRGEMKQTQVHEEVDAFMLAFSPLSSSFQDFPRVEYGPTSSVLYSS